MEVGLNIRLLKRGKAAGLNELPVSFQTKSRNHDKNIHQFAPCNLERGVCSVVMAAVTDCIYLQEKSNHLRISKTPMVTKVDGDMSFDTG